MQLFEMYATLGIDDRGFQKGIDADRRMMQDFAGSADGGANSLRQMFSMTGGMQLSQTLDRIRTAAINFAKESISLASGLEEVQNVVDVTFGDGAATINSWSKRAISAYGLSELKAKQYTGTIGAMLKSMGLADDQVVEMATSVVGLTGDMASFYNLEHEAAFEKIRSGLSGETEPLKQLGINMSVANLEAYALSKGLDKTYQSMTQAEQAMIRYEYLLSATSDAQGDFSRTSGGYANALRLFQENLDSVSADFGASLLSFVTPALNEINGWFAAGSFEKEMRSIAQAQMSAIAEANLQYSTVESILADLKESQTAVDGVSSGVAAVRANLEKGLQAGGILDDTAEKASALSTGASSLSGVADAVGSISSNMYPSTNGKKNILDEISSSAESGNENISGIASGFQSIQDVLTSNSETYTGLLNQISSMQTASVELISKQTEVQTAVSATDAMISAQSGLGEAVGGMERLTQAQEEAKKSAEDYRRSVQALVRVMPDLNVYVDQNTGALTASVDVIESYAEAIKDLQIYRAQKESVNQYEDTAEAKRQELEAALLQQELNREKYNTADALWDSYRDELIKKYGLTDEPELSSELAKGVEGKLTVEELAYMSALQQLSSAGGYEGSAAEKADNEYISSLKTELSVLGRLSSDTEENIDKNTNDLTVARDEFAALVQDLKANATELENKVREIEAYRDRTVQAAREALTASVSGLENAPELTTLYRTTDTIKKNLENQKLYFEQYALDLEKARGMGFDADLLAQLSSGDEQSVADLHAIVAAGDDEAKRINQIWREAQVAKEAAAQGMAANQLSADASYQQLMADASELETIVSNMVAEADQKETAFNNMKGTAAGLTEALNGSLPDIRASVSAVIAELSRLSAVNISIPTPYLGGFSGIGGLLRTNPGSNAKGLDRVPYDDYLTYLHKDETVLSRPEAEEYRASRNTTPAPFDYNLLGKAVKDALVGVSVMMGASKVGELVTETVSREIEREIWRGTYT